MGEFMALKHGFCNLLFLQMKFLIYILHKPFSKFVIFEKKKKKLDRNRLILIDIKPLEVLIGI